MEAKLSNRPLFIPPSLEEASWQQIKEISDAGLASSCFKVGDMKKIVLNGMVGTVEFNNYETYVYIIGIDHNKEVEGTGITFGCFKNKDGVDIALVDDVYDYGYINGDKYFNMNHSSNTNAGGWTDCNLRYDILGSTYSEGEPATEETVTEPVPNTLMAALPSDLRAVMKEIIAYTDNEGGGNNDENNVSEIRDYLPLLSEYEIFGTRKLANSVEKNYQKQYAYYSAGNSKVKYRYNETSSAVWWWERSPFYNNNSYFCCVTMNGDTQANSAKYSYGIAPIFRV